MKSIGVTLLKRDPRRYLRDVERGQDYQITRYGRPTRT